MEGTSYVSPFRIVFFLPCDHGLYFDISLCESSINKKIDFNIHVDLHLGIDFNWNPGMKMPSEFLDLAGFCMYYYKHSGDDLVFPVVSCPPGWTCCVTDSVNTSF